jgi:hypothetical protein
MRVRFSSPAPQDASPPHKGILAVGFPGPSLRRHDRAVNVLFGVCSPALHNLAQPTSDLPCALVGRVLIMQRRSHRECPMRCISSRVEAPLSAASRQAGRNSEGLLGWPARRQWRAGIDHRQRQRQPWRTLSIYVSTLTVLPVIRTVLKVRLLVLFDSRNQLLGSAVTWMRYLPSLSPLILIHW